MSTTTNRVTAKQRDPRGIPLAPTITVLRPSGYGLIPDLLDEEPADEEELERLAVFDLFGPVLALKPRKPDDWKELARNWGGGR